MLSFEASLYPRGQAISFDAEGEATVKLVAPASEIEALMRFMTEAPGKSFRIVVDIENQLETETESE
jgi:hypothetical protein